jgi:hypothetical protein
MINPLRDVGPQIIHPPNLIRTNRAKTRYAGCVTPGLRADRAG